jgi:hypothetical protein
VFQALNENNFRPRILYPAKLSFKVDGGIKVFYDKQKLKTMYDHQGHHYRRFYKEFCTQKVKANKTLEDGKYQTAGEEKKSNWRAALIQLHTIKSLNNKNN